MTPPNVGGTTGGATGGTKPAGTTRGRTIARRRNRGRAVGGGQAYGDTRQLIGNGGVDGHVTNTKLDRTADMILMKQNWTRDDLRTILCGGLGIGD